jgi:hypothetical protein
MYAAFPVKSYILNQFSLNSATINKSPDDADSAPIWSHCFSISGFCLPPFRPLGYWRFFLRVKPSLELKHVWCRVKMSTSKLYIALELSLRLNEPGLTYPYAAWLSPIPCGGGGAGRRGAVWREWNKVDIIIVKLTFSQSTFWQSTFWQ